MARAGIVALGMALMWASAQAQTPPPAPAQTPPAAPTQTAPTAGGFVGSNACRTCHADVFQNFFRNPHFKSLASGKEPPERTGCESCHGPGKAHVEARGGKTTIPHAFSLMPPKAVLEDCLTCHAKDLNRVNIRRSEHTQHDVACTSCHSIHHSATAKYLLAKQQREVCYGCHAPVRAQFQMPFKHRVNEGFMECSDCHNPHGAFAPTWRMGQRPRMVEQAGVNETACVRCHTDKRGPFVFEHAPARIEGCETCHQPHGSTNARLLRRPVVFTLCLECHNGTASGLTGAGVPLQSSRHNLLDPKYQRCTTCHVRIHGSNSDEYFKR
jgi:DmsE family decaheme c-type cytochrome